MKNLLCLFVLCGSVLGALAFVTNISSHSVNHTAKLKEGQTIQEGSLVSIEYTLKDEMGKVIESSKDKEPLTYVHGAGQIVPGLEKALTGLRPGDEKTVTVKPEEGYGAVNPDLTQELPKEKLPPDALKVDTMLMMKTPQGPIPIRVKEIKEKTVVVDLNSPLAGKTLTFDVKIKDIREASKN
jgi:FKBP-type peptidyl-prolyl cis-trans isomerase SlyD